MAPTQSPSQQQRGGGQLRADAASGPRTVTPGHPPGSRTTGKTEGQPNHTGLPPGPNLSMDKRPEDPLVYRELGGEVGAVLCAQDSDSMRPHLPCWEAPVQSGHEGLWRRASGRSACPEGGGQGLAGQPDQTA